MFLLFCRVFFFFFRVKATLNIHIVFGAADEQRYIVADVYKAHMVDGPLEMFPGFSEALKTRNRRFQLKKVGNSTLFNNKKTRRGKSFQLDESPVVRKFVYGIRVDSGFVDNDSSGGRFTQSKPINNISRSESINSKSISLSTLSYQFHSIHSSPANVSQKPTHSTERTSSFKIPYTTPVCRCLAICTAKELFNNPGSLLYTSVVYILVLSYILFFI